MPDYWDEQKVVKEIQRGERGDMIKVTLCRKGKNQFVDVRNYFVNSSGVLTPTRKGIAIPADLVNDVADALEEVKEEVLENLAEVS